MDTDLLVTRFEAIRPELRNYLTRMVLRPQIAEDLVQSTYLRVATAPSAAPENERALKAWIFRIATNLALDELKRHSSWKEVSVMDLRQTAESNSGFTGASVRFIGTPETKAIAKEHVAACFSCTLRNLPQIKAAALLLKEVFCFSLDETAEILEARAVQVKNWIQEARQRMDGIFGSTCALMSKNGVCYQCVELADFFAGDRQNPLDGSSENVSARLSILQDLRRKPLGRWHTMLFELLEEVD